MRLKKEEISVIKSITRNCFGDNAKVFLFGSRVDDAKKGGDIDLYIETDYTGNTFQQKLKMLGDLHDIIGEQKIDIVINNFLSDKYIFQIARQEGVQL